MLPENRERRSRLLRCARLLLDWSQARLACEAGISTGMVYAVESGRLHCKSPAALAVVQALESAGVAFIRPADGQGHGVRYACDGSRQAGSERRERGLGARFEERLR